MQPTSEFCVRQFILILVILVCIKYAVSDLGIFADDLYADEFGSDIFLDDADGSSLLSPSMNDYFTDDLADSFLVGDVQSCSQPGKKVKTRRSDAESCANPDTPDSPTYTDSDERLLTTEEVQKYWCGKFRVQTFAVIPVCSVDPAYLNYYDELLSTRSQSFIEA